MAGLNHQVPGELVLSHRLRAVQSAAFLSEHSNQDEEADLDQESGGHDGDGKKHVARRERGHSAR